MTGRKREALEETSSKVWHVVTERGLGLERRSAGAARGLVARPFPSNAARTGQSGRTHLGGLSRGVVVLRGDDRPVIPVIVDADVDAHLKARAQRLQGLTKPGDLLADGKHRLEQAIQGTLPGDEGRGHRSMASRRLICQE